jgi:hypothetical protein
MLQTENSRISFLFKAEYDSIAFAFHLLLICHSVHGHVGGVYLLAVVTHSAMSVGVQVSL